MARNIHKNVRLFAVGCDLTGQTNKASMEMSWETKDVTTFGSVDANGTLAKEVLPGLSSFDLKASGFFEAGDPGKVDDALWAAAGGVGPWTLCPIAATPGSLAWLGQAATASYQVDAAPGEAAGFAASAIGTGGLARGQALTSPGVAITAIGAGSIVNLGAVPAGRTLYASLHVLSVAGTATPTITAKVQSAAAAGFGSPTDRILFAAATARGGQFGQLAGPVTDAYYRLSWTVTGTTPSFLVAAAVGIA